MITWKKEIDAKKIGAEITAIVFYKNKLDPKTGFVGKYGVQTNRTWWTEHEWGGITMIQFGQAWDPG